MKSKHELVAMEKKICLVTGREYETGSLLLATSFDSNGEPFIETKVEYPDGKKSWHTERLGDPSRMYPDRDNTVTGTGFSPEVQEKLDAGYVALVCINSKLSNDSGDKKMKPSDAYRTGEVIYMKKEVTSKVFAAEVESMAFIDENVTKLIKEAAPKE